MEMEKKEGISGTYTTCDHIPRIKLENAGISKPLERSFDVLPLYESEMFKRRFINHYSFIQNRNMACRWEAYRNKNMANKKKVPVQVPQDKDVHFFNQTIGYRPDTTHQDCRYKMRPGPGVDTIGQLPISQDALIKHSVKTVTVKPKKAGIENEKENGNVLDDTKK